MNFLEVSSLTIKLGQRTLCENLDLEIQGGQNWAILGPNGCGKTTLLHTLAGLIQQSNGSITLNHRPLSNWTPVQRALKIGILLQKEETYFPASVLETVLTGRHPHVMARGLAALLEWEENEDISIAEKALRDVDMFSFRDRITTSLSGGEWRRVMIAALLTQDTDITLYDEIANHLDLNHQQKIMNLVTDRISKGSRANVFVLQDVNQALRYCNHGLLMFDDGRHITGPLSEIISVKTLEDLYHCPFIDIAHQQQKIYMPV